MANRNDTGEVYSGEEAPPPRSGSSSRGGAVLLPASYISTVVSKTDLEKKRFCLDTNEVQVHIVPNLELHQRMSLNSIKKPVAIPMIDAQTGQAYWPSLYLTESSFVLSKVSNIIREYGLVEGDKIILWHQSGVTMLHVQK